MTEKTQSPNESVTMHVSLFKTIVIEIGGQQYPVRRIARHDQLEIEKFDDMIKNGDLDAQYKRLEFLLDLKKSDPNIDALSTQEVSDITQRLIVKLYSADADDMRFSGDSKNVRRRGNIKPAK